MEKQGVRWGDSHQQLFPSILAGLSYVHLNFLLDALSLAHVESLASRKYIAPSAENLCSHGLTRHLRNGIRSRQSELGQGHHLHGP
jgi:hypothetical protein